jgi:hypothetical protein
VKEEIPATARRYFFCYFRDIFALMRIFCPSPTCRHKGLTKKSTRGRHYELEG